ncbi:MAG TPA: phytanoyl-CoA dioxygenase family protein [Pyrinomonadaceae bacterium]
MLAEIFPTNVSIEEIEVSARNLDPKRAAAIFEQYGCVVVRGLMSQYLDAVRRDIEMAVEQAYRLLGEAEAADEGWRTPDGSLFLPARHGAPRDRQIMVLGLNYHTSAAFFLSALDPLLLNIVEAILGPAVELFENGHCMYKEPNGGHPKYLHQDSAYYEHRLGGPVAVLNYAVDTGLTNGALYVVPGSHCAETLTHVDSFTHLALREDEWPWERALPIIGSAGDSIFYHYRIIHGSQENRSPEPRPVFIHRYRHPDDYVTFGGATTSKRAETQKRIAASSKSGQKGLMVRGFRLLQK